MARIDDTAGFRLFAASLEQRLESFEAPDNLLVHQRNQLKTLITTEKAWARALQKSRSGEQIYREFVIHICEERRNILAARPFYRERQTLFTSHISKAFKTRSHKKLYRFRANWTFIQWVMSQRKWGEGSEVRQLANKIEELRTELLEQNLPLAISQARIFWNSTPKSHLTYMDILQTQCQGLLLAIDKFSPPDESKMTKEQALKAWQSFRAVAIGIMRRDRVNSYSESLIHFFPADKAKIYIANKLLRRFSGEVDYTKLAELVNRHLIETGAEFRTTPEELAGLLCGASTVSGDFAAEPEGETVLESTASTEDTRPDSTYEDQEARTVLHHTISSALTIRERKLLIMKGISHETTNG